MTFPNDTAFPVLDQSQTPNSTAQLGLTKLEYFAAMAMQGLCANSIPGSHHSFKQVASEAVEYAKALIGQLRIEDLRETNRILGSLPATGDIVGSIIANDAEIAKAEGSHP